MAEEQSLITDEHRSVIGQKGDPVTVVLSEVNAGRMRDVLEDSDARWADGTGVGAPYTIASLSGGRPARMVQVLPGGLLTQQEWKFSRPFQIGEELQAISQIIDIRERLGGRYGHSVLVTTSTDYYDAKGEHVAASLVTVTQFDPSKA
jgi:hypothetical protein